MPRILANARKRVINFRVTEQEYTAVLTACALDGGLNLSEFARRAMVDTARSRISGGAALQEQLDSLGQKLARVDVALGELVSSLNHTRSNR